MSAFPWSEPENVTAQNARVAYAQSLKDQVDQRANAASKKKQQQIAADRLDDERVIREQQTFAAQQQGEIQAQRNREELVARREAFAAQQAALREPTRAEKIEQYQTSQVQNRTQLEGGISFGDDGYGQASARNQRTGLAPHGMRASVAHQSSIEGGPIGSGPAPPAARPLVQSIRRPESSSIEGGIFGGAAASTGYPSSSAQAENEAGLARAAASTAAAGARPDQTADAAAAAIKRRAQGSSSLW